MGMSCLAWNAVVAADTEPTAPRQEDIHILPEDVASNPLIAAISQMRSAYERSRSAAPHEKAAAELTADADIEKILRVLNGQQVDLLVALSTPNPGSDWFAIIEGALTWIDGSESSSEVRYRFQTSYNNRAFLVRSTSFFPKRDEGRYPLDSVVPLHCNTGFDRDDFIPGIQGDIEIHFSHEQNDAVAQLAGDFEARRSQWAVIPLRCVVRAGTPQFWTGRSSKPPHLVLDEAEIAGAPVLYAKEKLAESEMTSDERAAESARKEAVRRRNLIVVGAVLLLSVAGLILGLTNRAVFYASMAEVAILLGLLFSVVVVMLLGGTVLEGNDVLMRRVMLGLMAATALYSYATAFVCNRNPVTGLCVGTAKLIIVVLFVLSVLQILAPGGKTRREQRNARVTGAAGVGLLGFLITHLVNGDRPER
jgi:hypothetical protein